jgi:hypothetical protein
MFSPLKGPLTLAWAGPPKPLMLRCSERLNLARFGKESVRKALAPVALFLLVLIGLFFLLRPDPPVTEPRTRAFELRVRDDAVTPGEILVGEGDKVIIQVSVDHPTEIHLHGYDIEREVRPRELTKISFAATLTGRFEIEPHVAHVGGGNHAGEEDHAHASGTLIVEPR